MKERCEFVEEGVFLQLQLLQIICKCEMYGGSCYNDASDSVPNFLGVHSTSRIISIRIAIAYESFNYFV